MADSISLCLGVAGGHDQKIKNKYREPVEIRSELTFFVSWNILKFEMVANTNKKTNNAAKVSRLFRSKTDRMFAGICGGLGEFFSVDSTLFRILFVLLTLGGGAGIVLYIVLWILIPGEGESGVTSETIHNNIEDIKSRAHDLRMDIKKGRGERPHSAWAVIIIIIGFWFLLSNLGLISNLRSDLVWPVILIIFGVVLLLRV